MKKRYYFWLTIIIITSVVWWQKYSIEQYIENEVKEILLSATDGQIIFDEVSIGVNSLHLHELRFVLGDQISNVHIGYVEVGYNPINLLSNQFDIVSTIESIKLRDGSITLFFKNMAESKVSFQNEESSEDPLTSIHELWLKYGNNQKIELSNFSLNANLEKFGIKPIVRSLEGFAVLKPTDLQLVLSGNLMYSKDKNTILFGDITRDSLNLEIKWNKIDFHENWPFKHFTEISDVNGLFTGNFTFKSSWSELEDFQLSGNAFISDMAFKTENIDFYNGKIEVVADEKSKLMTSASGNVNRNIINSEGIIELKHIKNSYMDVSANINDLSLFAPILGVKKVKGKGVASGKIKFGPGTYLWNMNTIIKLPSVDDYKADSLYADLKGDFEMVSINKLELFSADQKLNLTGKYNFDGSDAIIKGDWQGWIPEKLGPVDLRKQKYYVDYDIRQHSTKVFSGDFSVILAENNFRIIEGNLKTESGHHLLYLIGDSLSQITGEFDLWDSFLQGQVVRGALNLPGNVFRQLGVQSKYSPAFVNISFDGNEENLSTSIALKHNKKFSLDFNGDFGLKKDSEFFLGLLSLNFEDFHLEGPIDWSRKDEEFSVSLVLGNSVRLKFKNNKLFESYSGQLFLENLPLKKILSPWYDQVQNGFINANMNFQYLESLLTASGKMNADKVVLNNVGYYTSDLDFKVSDNVINLDNFSIYLNYNPVLKSNGVYNIDEKIYKFDLSGHDIDLEYLSETFFNKKEFASGRADFDVNLSANSDQEPVLDLFFTGRDGLLGGIPFDNINTKLRANEDSVGWRADIEDFYWFHEKDIDLTVTGKVPFNNISEFDLSIDFTGDALKYLNNFESFFTSGKSNSNISLKIGGSLTNPIIDEASIEITDGYLAMADVIDEIENIRFSVEKRSGTNFVRIKELTGEIDNGTVHIHSLEEPPPSKRELETWYFSDLDLDFGILVIKTSSNGIPLKIFGPMRRGESGRIELAGREPGEEFYFAGPVFAPVARGKGVVKNASITYPFLTSGEKSDPTPAILFLKTIDWNVLAQPSKDVHYVNEVNAYLDNIYIDMTAEPERSQLDISGRLADETFAMDGVVISRTGSLEYLDFSFRVEEFSVKFNPNKNQPEVFGAAVTTVRDTVGDFPRDIYLRLYSKDPVTGSEKIGGDWTELRFKIETSNPGAGETESDVLAYLGYSGANIQSKATSVGGAVADNLFFRPIVRPIEKSMEDIFGLDVVRVNAVFTKNIFSSSFNNQLDISNPGSDIYRGRLTGLAMFDQSRLTLGKYVYSDLYLTYTGQLVGLYDESTVGLNHRFGLEYRMFKNFLFEVQYDFNRVDYQYFALPQQYDDLRFRIKHSISF